jgi:KDO2-lipid IV(A) lauroyltransferase
MGLQRTRRLTKYFSYIVYYLIPLRKNIVFSNIKSAFPEKSDSEINELTLSTYRNILITFFELMILPFISENELISSVTYENYDLLQRLSNDHKGLMLLTGHLGGWELCPSAIKIKLGRKLYILAKPQSNSLTSNWVMNAREKFGNKVILSGISVKNIYQKIKEGEIVIVGGDQRGNYEGPRFQFFKISTALYLGAASIALKTNCPIIITIFERQPDYSYIIYFEELDLKNLSDNYDKNVIEITQRYVSSLEKYIKKNPEQYFWLHKLWKY